MDVTGIVGAHVRIGLLNVMSASPTSIFTTSSTPADKVRLLSLDVLITLGVVFLAVAALMTHVLVHYRARKGDDTEPPQVFGSAQIELSWTIIPTLIIVVLFLGTARVVFEVQDAPEPASALDITVVGHQFWWEFSYPKFNVTTANELHIPVSDPKHPTPTYLKLTSADVIHSFWVPSLAGKTDLLPNRVNEMWVDPHKVGLFLGQCAQFCGAQHARMLLRIYVDSPEQFRQWIAMQQQGKLTKGGAGSVASRQKSSEQPAQSVSLMHVSNAEKPQLLQKQAENITAEEGRRVFETRGCISCHAIAGTAANGRFGPDLTHLMTRSTIAAGITPNTPETLLAWIKDPNGIKPGSLMPAMHLTTLENKQLTAYLITLY